MRYIVVALLLSLSNFAYSAPQEGDGKLIFPVGHAYQVERAWPESGIVCANGGTVQTCDLGAGTYKWLDWTDDTEGYYTSLANTMTPEDIADAVDGLTTSDVEAIVARLTDVYLVESEVQELIMASLVDIGLCPAGSSLVGQ